MHDRGFEHEGTRRRAFRCPYAQEFKDATYLGMLATDWEMRSYAAPGLKAKGSDGRLPASRFSVAPASLWDEMFQRHQRERDALLRWQETNDPTSRLERTMSSETIKETYHFTVDSEDDSASEIETTDSESTFTSRESRTSSMSGAASKKPMPIKDLQPDTPEASFESELAEMSEPAVDWPEYEANSGLPSSPLSSETTWSSGAGYNWEVMDDVEYVGIGASQESSDSGLAPALGTASPTRYTARYSGLFCRCSAL